MTAQPLTAVVAPLPEEAAALRRRIEHAARISPRNATAVLRSLHVGHLGPSPLALAVTGDGARNARSGIRCLLATLPVRRLVVIGVAGGLDAALAPGSLVVARRVCTEALSVDAEPRLVEMAAEATGAQPALVVTVSHLLDSSAEKARCRARFASMPGDTAAVADLESAVFAEAAERAGVPWLVLRAVSDGASEALPDLLSRCRDEAGAIVRLAVLRRALIEPSAIPSLVRLSRRVTLGAKTLADAVEALLPRWNDAIDAS